MCRPFWTIFLFFFFAKTISCRILCNRPDTGPILNCSDSKSASGESLHEDCFPSYSILTLNLENTSELDKSTFQDCTTAIRLEVINGTVEKIGPGTFKDWNNLKFIDLSGNRIRTLKNGSFFLEQQFYANWFSINVSRNEINRIEDDAIKVIRLQHSALTLNLSHNQLTSFNLSSVDVKVVNFLDLTFNSIKDLRGNSKVLVDRLDLSHNSIKDLERLDFPSQDYLDRLYLSHNDIKVLPLKTFSKMNKLHVLDLSHNKLSNLQFGVFNNLSQLGILDISNNQLVTKSLDTVHMIPNLRQLYFHNNHVDQLNLKDFTKLSVVSFFGNKITFNCQQLAKDLRGFRFSRVVNGPDLDVENIHGMACTSNGETASEDEALVKTLKNFTKHNSDLIKTIEESNNWKYEQVKSTNENLESHLEKYEKVLEESLGRLLKIEGGSKTSKLNQVPLDNGLKSRLTLISIQFTILILFVVLFVLYRLWRNNFRFWTRRRGGSFPYQQTGRFMNPSVQELNEI